ncbi:MAG: hypothetical protein A3G76_10185 [Acidobacteria bacterium RIFCSPLOWO2_12_FULL_65_11]|nr:MAG: hypothetical protein A3H95_14765 [Acidobacteria bacterium RIFCSPLOWO2_02_FULL_64_15]OFW31649.1 MAG: hypothetical protein A3G76_10185 [Acidobacteria bacterium RIFCSPLOWO2_12_FULL_65_11]
MAAERSWVGVATAATGVGVSQEPAPVDQAQIAAGFGTRLAAAAADNTIATFMTTAVASSLFRQDPRYFAAGRDKGFARRAAYAASRVLVTRGESGRPQFNVSRVAGNAGAVGISTLYNPTTDSSVSGMLTSVGTRLLWDAVSNELGEFWPDIRRAIFRH